MSLDTLEGIDAEIQFQQQLRRKTSKENLAQIDKEIKRLNDLKTAFEDSSHAALATDQIHTYEQLDNELAFYQKKLKTATATERIEIQKQIEELERLRGKWDDVLSAMDKPAAIGSLNSMEEPRPFLITANGNVRLRVPFLITANSDVRLRVRRWRISSVPSTPCKPNVMR